MPNRLDKNLYQPRGLRWRDLRTGLVGTAGLAVMAWLALVIGENNSLFSRAATLTFFCTDVKGLVEGNQVTISGRKVGTVEAMEIVPSGDSIGVRVTLRIKHDYLSVLTTDTRAVIKSLGVLGDKYVDLVRGSGKPMPDGGEIAMEVEPGIENLTVAGLDALEGVNRLGDNLSRIVERINRGEGTIGRLLTTNDLGNRLESIAQRVDAAAISLQAILNAARNGRGLLPRLLNDPAVANRAVGLVDELEGLAAQVRGGTGTIGRLLSSDSLYLTISELTSRIDSIASRFASPAGSLGKLSSDTALYDNLNSGLRSLDSLLQDLRLHPDRYVSISVF